MWWTQPKLAMIALGANATAFLVLALASSILLVQLVGLVVTQAILLFVYSRAAHRLGVQHLDGKTEAAFNARVWNKRWNPHRDAYCHPPDLLPLEEGGSFYQQVLGDTPIMRESLYRALSMWEGARFLWIGNTVAVGAALGSSTIGLAWAATSDGAGPVALITSAAMPLCIILLPEVVNIMLLKRSILRHGAVPRVAMLLPRDAVDLGFKTSMPPEVTGSALETVIVFGVVLGIPFLMLLGFIAGIGVAALSLVALAASAAAGLWAFHAFLRLLTNGIPFLRFGGPVEISVALDLAHRQRAYLSLSALLPLAWVGGWYFHNEIDSGLLSPWPFVWLGYLVAITFGDQLSGYAGFFGAARFHECFKRSLAKMPGVAP